MSKRSRLLRMMWAITLRAKGDGSLPDDVDKLMTLSRRVNSLDVRDCNQGLTAMEERRREGYVSRAAVIASRFGASVYVQDDPRGCSLYLIFPGDIPHGGKVESHYTNGVALA